MTKYELIVKEEMLSYKSDTKKFVFVVVDRELGDKYPKNFVCIFPKYLVSHSKHYSLTFGKLFGQQARTLAKELLKNLKAKTAEPEILLEIDNRLKELELASWRIERKCVDCKEFFMPTSQNNIRCQKCVRINQAKYRARFGAN